MQAALERHKRVIGEYARNARGPYDLVGLLRAGYLRPHRKTIAIGSQCFGTVTIRPRTTDISVAGEIFAGAYMPAIRAARDPELVVDLGAHIGLVSATFTRAFPGARIVAVEANPRNVPLLRRNAPAATVIDRPIAATYRRVGMTGDRLDGYHLVEGGDLETITVGDIPGRIGLLKIDIEGVEEELLADCHDWIGRVDVLVCECHHPYTGDDMLSALRRNGAEPAIVARLDLPMFGYDLVTVSL